MSNKNSFMLTSVGEFSNLKAKPGFKKSKSFLCFYKNSFESNQVTKIGISINSKLCNAVSRNKIRRWIKSAYRDSEDNLQHKGLDVLFVLSKKCQIDRLSFIKVKKEFNFILSNI
ncbi:ribonuclease P protein component [Bacteriovoracaceae bacterium]|nr:ribonuclease P protein component [Bacteriovoracaceae bacterium]